MGESKHMANKSKSKPDVIDESAQAAKAQARTDSLKTLLGILNKLTPEKFETLLSQLLDTVSEFMPSEGEWELAKSASSSGGSGSVAGDGFASSISAGISAAAAAAVPAVKYVSDVIRLIYEKAVRETNFAEMYADL